ncbi:MAG: aspartate kinase [Anaerolineales bacterium]|nr:aspartate kinase [Anaerolineales bacterium]
MKFGGSSVGDAQAIEQAAGIIEQAHKTWPRLVVVASAMAGVTNRLLDSATHAARGDTQLYVQSARQFYGQHNTVIQALIPAPAERSQLQHEIKQLIGEFKNLCQAVNVLGETTARALDAVASLGERMSVRLLTQVLQARGVPAVYVEATRLIVTDNRFQDAHPDLEATARLTRQALEPLLDGGQIPIVTGFVARSVEGATTTLGRGGSDYSAALIGAALEADDVWIWTDVPGVMTADPRLAPDARTITELSYREVAELAYFGAKVLHPKTIRPVIEAGIGLRVCDTFNPDHPGTRITPDANSNGTGKIKAVTLIRQQRLITIEGRGMLGVPGVAARTFGAVAATGTSVPLITQASSEQSICFAAPSQSTQQVIASLENVFERELASRDIDRIWATGEVVIVTVVGAGMRNTPGIAGKIFSSLGARGVNVIAIAQGSSEVSISLVVDAGDAEAAALALHELVS